MKVMNAPSSENSLEIVQKNHIIVQYFFPIKQRIGSIILLGLLEWDYILELWEKPAVHPLTNRGQHKTHSTELVPSWTAKTTCENFIFHFSSIERQKLF